MAPIQPVIGLTMGDPAGIGPEIIAGAWSELFSFQPSGDVGNMPSFPALRPLILGEPEIMRRALQLRQVDAQLVLVDSIDDFLNRPELTSPQIVPCLNCCNAEATTVVPGQISATGGQAAFDCLNRAIDLALAGKIDAIATAPLNKKSLDLAGHHYPGHTEILAARCGVNEFGMMLFLGPGPELVSPTGLAVVHVTLHTAMKNIFSQITKKSVCEKIELVRDFMLKIKGEEPIIGVCSLNCHNGEQGLLGMEEIETIRPAVELMTARGRKVFGPFPSDTLMIDARSGRFDGIVAMIHDQGHIAIKLMAMHRAVNITLGLPIIRTSVAHGTAFDLAGKGTANVAGMIEAVRVAARLTKTANKFF